MEKTVAEEEWNEIHVDEPEFEVDDNDEVVGKQGDNDPEEQTAQIVEVDEDAPDPDPTEEAPELQGVDTEGAQKRIRQLVRQRKEREEAIIRQQQEVESLKRRLYETEQKNTEVFKSNYNVTEKQLKEKAEMARSAYLRAYDDGDKEAMLAAQEAMFDARQNIQQVRQGRGEVEAYQQNLAKQAAYANNKANTPQQPAYDPMAIEWAESNKWFGQDHVATAAALAIDATLKNEGYDPSDETFYKEVDRRLRQELPNKFGVASSPTGEGQTQEQVVGGQSRKSPDSVKGRNGNRRVKMTREDVALAKKWNIPLERYAKEKAKAERATADDDYTTISVGS